MFYYFSFLAYTNTYFLYWHYHLTISFRISRMISVPFSIRTTSLPIITRCVPFLSLGRRLSKSLGKFLLAKPGGNEPFFSNCFANPGGKFSFLAKPGGIFLDFPFLSVCLFLLEQNILRLSPFLPHQKHALKRSQ